MCYTYNNFSYIEIQNNFREDGFEIIQENSLTQLHSTNTFNRII